MIYFAMRPVGSADDQMGDVMRLWLAHDPVALAVLVVGIAAVEWLSLSF
jgi:hypothetical protein